MTKLKPCPFCEGEAHITNFDVFGGVHYVVCKGCGGRIQMPSKAEAIAAWNRRAKNPLTPADRIRSMSDKELAEYIFDLGNGSEYCYGHCAYQDDCATKGLDHDTCIKGVIDWLQQPAKEVHNMSEDKTLYWIYADIDEVIDMDYRERGSEEKHK